MQQIHPVIIHTEKYPGNFFILNQTQIENVSFDVRLVSLDTGAHVRKIKKYGFQRRFGLRLKMAPFRWLLTTISNY